MTPRTRRLAGVLGVAVALLFVARWSVGILAERWWAATISAPAASFVTRWQLLGLALEGGAIVVASIWFAIHALLVARAIASVQVARHLGNLQLRVAVPTRLLLAGAIASGILLGVISGSGAHSWREPVLLAWQGVHYGVTDPLLGLDAGVFVGQLPAWDLAHRFAALLAVVGLVFTLTLYSAIGGLRREGGVVVVHPDARRHLGALLVLVALVIAAGYVLAPYHLAGGSLLLLGDGGAETQVRAAEIMTGLAAATAILSLVWALHGRNTVLATAWIVLGLGAICERYAVPALAEAAAPSPGQIAAARQFDAIAWGFRLAAPVTQPDSIPAVTAIWDAPLLSRLVERNGGTVAAATQGEAAAPDGRIVPVWLVAMAPPGTTDALDVLAVADGVTGPAGTAILFGTAADTATNRPVWRTLADARVRPSARSWRAVASGVDAASPLRRVLLAWARQAPGMLGQRPETDVDWHLDPTDRAAAVLPMFSWSPGDLVILNDRPTWLVQGILGLDAFPLATRGRWRDADVAGAVPEAWCSMDAATGATHCYLDPAADSLGLAWARLIGPLVAPAAAMPPELRAQARYPAEWLDAQLGVLRVAPWVGGQRRNLAAGSVGMAPVWLAGGVAGRQAVLEDAETGVPVLIVTAFRRNGMPEVRIERQDSALAPGDRQLEFRQLWRRAAALKHLRDSATAAGDTIWSRSVRWLGGRELATWQPVFALPSRGEPTLLWIATALGDRVGGGRTPIEAWRAASERDHGAAPAWPSDAATLDLSRQWLQRADSALRRGDMTAFGRAFEELRRALAKRPVASEDVAPAHGHH